ncbi:MAG: hypothetical protein JO368_12180, partial [Acidimicrobiales bacterium]|nr:hypothetical protein [Acidimicrobiales bacterium]
MKRILFAAVPAVLALATMAPPASAAPGDVTVTLPGTSHFLGIWSLPQHGRLASFETYYAWDHYVHIDDLSSAPNVTDIQMFICVNPESTLPNHGLCDDHIDSTDVDAVGTLGQPHTRVHHHVTL